MKVAELLDQRRRNWQELERLCARLAGRRRSLPPDQITRFARLYRAACADLALADAYQLPPGTVDYLNRLVGRAHNVLYRSRPFQLRTWRRVLLVETPQRVFQDRCVQLMFCLFFGVFALSALLAYSPRSWPGYAERVITPDVMEMLEQNFKDPLSGRHPRINMWMAAFYIQHNAGIGLKCFALGLLVLPGLFITLFNAAHLGACFGYMARPELYANEGAHFFEFVTAHGPFELTAIALSAGAGLRLGLAWLTPGGWARGDSLRRTAGDAMPLMGTAIILFCLAALLEGFLSPSAAPYWVKAGAAALSSGVLMFYFVVLGFPRSGSRAAG